METRAERRRRERKQNKGKKNSEIKVYPNSSIDKIEKIMNPIRKDERNQEHPYNHQMLMSPEIFEGMDTNVLNEQNPPLFLYLLTKKIKRIPLYQIMDGKKEIKIKGRFSLETIYSRSYEFQLNDQEPYFLHLLLILKNKDDFFPDIPDAYISDFTGYQIIPLSYSSMSKMSKEQIRIIWVDFD